MAPTYSTGDSFFVRIISAAWTAGRKPRSSEFIVGSFVIRGSVGGASAGDVEHGASGKAAFIAGKPADQGCDFGDFAEAAGGDLRQHPVDLLLGHLGKQ